MAQSFQLATLAEPKPRSRKRTYAYLFRSMRTLRFLAVRLATGARSSPGPHRMDPASTGRATGVGRAPCAVSSLARP